jgi:hypothetical protein
MRTPLFLLGFGAVFSTAALGEGDCRCWTPGAADIAALEAKIAEQALPLGSLDRYARYYSGVVGRSSGLDSYVESNAGAVEKRRNRAIDHGGLPLFLRFDSSFAGGGSRVRGIRGALIPAGGDDLPRVHVEQRMN